MNVFTFRPLFATLAISGCLFVTACAGDGMGDDAGSPDTTTTDAGIGDTDAGSDDTDAGVISPTPEADIIALALGYATDDFTEVTTAPFASRHGGAMVTVFVSDDDVADYNTIDPSAVTGPTFNVGAMIVKQHKNAAGDDDAITVMYKQPAGYAPATNDWWWARIEANESVTVSGSSPTGCLGCHSEVAASDYVYGL